MEITPLVGYRVGGSFAAEVATGSDTTAIVDYEAEDAASFGAHLGFRVSRDGEIEVLYSRQSTRLATGGLFTGAPLFDLDLESWHAGGNYLFAEEDSRVRPYIGMGLGLTRLIPEPAGLETENRFAASSSPLLFEDTLIVQCDHYGSSYLLAIDNLSGANRWKTDRPEACLHLAMSAFISAILN